MSSHPPSCFLTVIYHDLYAQGLQEVCKGKKFTAPVHLEVDPSVTSNGSGEPEVKKPRTD